MIGGMYADGGKGRKRKRKRGGRKRHSRNRLGIKSRQFVALEFSKIPPLNAAFSGKFREWSD